jgi:hypothetical protein
MQSLRNTDPAAFKRYMAAKHPSASKPTYEELLAQLEKIANCATRANWKDSTGAPMVQLRAALVDQTRELVAAAKA